MSVRAEREKRMVDYALSSIGATRFDEGSFSELLRQEGYCAPSERSIIKPDAFGIDPDTGNVFVIEAEWTSFVDYGKMAQYERIEGGDKLHVVFVNRWGVVVEVDTCMALCWYEQFNGTAPKINPNA